MKNLILILALTVSITTTAQKIYKGSYVKNTLFMSDGSRFSIGERKESFTIKIDSVKKIISIQSGENPIIINITGKHRFEGNLVYEGCFNYQRVKTKQTGEECYCEMIIADDEIAVRWKTMLLEYYLD